MVKNSRGVYIQVDTTWPKTGSVWTPWTPMDWRLYVSNTNFNLQPISHPYQLEVAVCRICAFDWGVPKPSNYQDHGIWLSRNYSLRIRLIVWCWYIDRRLFRFLANVNWCSCSLLCRRPSVCRLSSVCCLSVTFAHPTQPIEIFDNVSALFNTLVTCDSQVKFYGDRPRETPPSGG